MPPSKDTIARSLETPYGERAYKIVETLTDKGFDTWWVGGCVRDMLQGTIPADIDIATSAKPDEVAALFKRSKDEGTRFGSVRILLGDDVFEITTFREDDEASDGRHPEAVTFGTREQDAKRRDFTVNAMYFHPITQEFYDPFGGEGDVKERLIRFIGEPAIRIKHDALRILRAVRFRARLDGQYHPETYAALREQAGLVSVLSGSRLLEETEKMLNGPHPDRAFEDLWELGILKEFLRELFDCKGIPQPADYHHEGDVWDHTMQVLRNFREEDTADARLAAFFHDCGKAKTFSLKERIRFDHHATISADLASQALKRLQCSGKRIEKIDWLVRHHMSMTFLEMPEERKGHWYFHPWFPELLQLFWLDIAGTTPSGFDLYDEILKDYNHFLDAHPRPEKPLLTGTEVMEILGLGPSEQVGKILKQLHEAQSKGEITTKKEAKEFTSRRQMP
ncbi:MAG: CCA tRNA nucleotidyltransferase [Candidatus Peribacteraceae bacterium]|nr:CCA tRNA nucleotidyltransferase [Candidatus Peribacteraceae bacterium]